MTAIIALSLLGILNLFLGFWLSRKTIQAATLLFLAGSMALTALDWNHELLWYGHMFHTTNTSISFSLIIQLAAFMVVSFSKGFGIDEEHTHPAEYYAILLFSVVGAILMVSFDHLIMFFVGLEILSVAMYVLTGSDKRNLRSNEAALKYFLMGSFATGILLFGITLVYGATRSFYLANIAVAIANTPPESTPVFLSIGVLLILVGFLFKISAAPFHFWTPDVYEGAPTPVTAFMASAGKVAAFAALLRILMVGLEQRADDWRPVVVVLAILTLVVGSVLAVVQTDVKRMLAYSSISHAGFILVGLVAAGHSASADAGLGTSGTLSYLFIYSILVIGTLGIVTIVAGKGDNETSLNAFKGLGKSNPVLAMGMTVLLLAQAGVPLTSGFVAKFGIIRAAVSTESYVLAVVAMLAAVIAAFLYLRIMVSMWLSEGTTSRDVSVAFSTRLAICLCVGATVVLGFFPSLLLQFTNQL